MAQLKFDFQNTHAVVTGGAQGIGFEIARSFLQAGGQVAIWDYSQDALQRAKSELSGFATRCTFSRMNVTDFSSCQSAAAELSSPVDVLVNNAGITRDKTLSKMNEDDFTAVINTNLTGLFNVTKSLLDKFNSSSANKRIINMSSVVALYGNFGQTNYVAAKAGVVGMTKTWAKELGRKGFTVNAIAPGFTRTSMVEAVPAEVLSGIEQKVPVQRLGEVQDIASACLFLASKEAAYINGVTLSVDGGLVLA